MSELPGPDFKKLFESSPNPYLVLLPDLRIVAVTDAYLKATMTIREKILGREIFDVFPDHPKDLSATVTSHLRASIMRAIKNKSADTMSVQKYDVRRPEAEGGNFEVRYWSPINTPVLDDNGQVLYVIHRFEDVTEFMRLHEAGSAQGKLNEQLRTRVSQMEEAHRLKTEFLANMSHELRTPLNAIIGFASLMHEDKVGAVSKEQKEFLGDILASSKHLLRLINDILDLAKVEAGKVEFYPERFELARVINEVKDVLRGLAFEKRIEISVKIHPGAKEVNLDPGKFKQVLYNYLSNAIKFTNFNGQVFVRTSISANGMLCIDVEDNGIGIKPEDLSKLFVEFHQLDSGVNKRHQGTGLGLALTKRLVEAQGGVVKVKSVWGTGTTFSAILPMGIE